MLEKKATAAATRLASKHATKLRAAMRKNIAPAILAALWVDTHKGQENVDKTHAVAWAGLYVALNRKAISEVLTQLQKDGWALGTDYSNSAYGTAALNAGKPLTPDIKASMRVNWDNWKPGNQAAADLLKPTSGLRDLLASQDITITGLQDTTIDRIGRVLADGLDEGANTEDIADGIDEVIGDPSRAEMIAQTEMSRAMSVATNDNYADLGVEQVEWLALEECELCAQNVDASPINQGDEFPSGDTEPPAHPNCRCVLAPVVLGFNEVSGDGLDALVAGDSGDEVPVDSLEMSASAMVAKFNENHDEHGRFSSSDNGPITKEAIDKKIEQLKTRDEKLGRTYARSEYLAGLIAAKGFDAKPEVVNSVADLKGDVIYRGIELQNGFTAAEVHNDFENGPMWVGVGMEGSGVYFSSSAATAGVYTRGAGTVITGALLPEAKIFEYDENSQESIDGLRTLMTNAEQNSNGVIPYGESRDPGVAAAWAGYDAIKAVNVFADPIYVVLNRGAMQVVKN